MQPMKETINEMRERGILDVIKKKYEVLENKECGNSKVIYILCVHLQYLN